MHTICKKSFRPPFKIGLRNAGQSRRGGLCEKKKEKIISHPVILRGRLQSREGAKASGSQTERTTISLRLCACLPQAGLCESKKKYLAREAAKTLRPPAGKNFRSLILETSLPRRLGVVHNFFAPTSAGRPAYRRQVFVRKKEKIISRPVILRGRRQSREGAKDSGRQFRFFLAT